LLTLKAFNLIAAADLGYDFWIVSGAFVMAPIRQDVAAVLNRLGVGR
jgi:hypothetical protein